LASETRLLVDERRQQIMSRVRRHGFASVSELADDIEVSRMTIRRDIEALSQRGLLEKLHGGAKLAGGFSMDEPGFESKSGHEEAEKRAIAVEAATLASPGLAVGISAGTTNWALANVLCRVPGLTIVTNSVRVANVFYDNPPDDESTGSNVILTGGTRTPSDALVGPVSVSSLAQLHLDLLFLGVHGVDEAAGFTTPNLVEAETNRAFIRSARRLVVLADHTKWGVIGMSTIADLDEADVVISDTGLSQEARETLADHVQELRLAEVPGAQGRDSTVGRRLDASR
jgi:DeoR family transcriptional regulator, fructose operon transcriptional repressor